MKTLMLKEFRKFAKRYPFVNLIVGVSFAGFLSKLITSFISDLFFPILKVLTGNENILKIEHEGIKIGHFLESLISFLIMFIFVYLIIKKKQTKMMKKINLLPPTS